jgi:hypothetical protein
MLPQTTVVAGCTGQEVKMFSLRRLLIASISLSLGVLLLPLSIGAANLLANDGLEEPYIQYGTYHKDGVDWPLQVADGWERFVIDQDGDRLRYFSSCEWREFNPPPRPPTCESRDGVDAQVWWSSKKFDSGIYQQVPGLTIGEDYGFQAGSLQVWETTISQTHGRMFRSVGIDPFGGTDPLSPNVLWGPEESRDVAWFYPGVGAQAMSTTVTVFVRVRSPNTAATPHSNQVWVDDTFMDVAPTTTVNLAADSSTQVSATWSGTPRAGFHLYAYEAQYRQASQTSWTNLQLFDSDLGNPPSTNTSASFSTVAGLQYVVRARTWHEQNAGPHQIPGPWTEATIMPGSLVVGNVQTNRGQGVSGATVKVSGSMTTTTSGSDGGFSLITGPGTFGLTATTTVAWAAPQPVQVTVAGTAPPPLTITLRPPNDVIQNGDFENTVAGWDHNLSVPVYVSTDHRSGDASLAISSSAGLTQTAVVSGLFEPVLSFWYRVASGDGDDTFSAEILGTNALTATNAFSTSTSGDWQHAWLPLDLTEIYTGSIGVRFNLKQTGPTPSTVYLDEVSLGSSWGGPDRNWLPAIFK